MEIEIIDLNEEQVEDIKSRLDSYDKNHITYRMSGEIKLGIIHNDKLVAGIIGCMTAFRIFYVSTMYVDETCRGKGLGTRLIKELETKAIQLGANMIRLDTFDWQGAEFYKKMEYTQVGSYKNDIDGFVEYFFLKRL